MELAGAVLAEAVVVDIVHLEHLLLVAVAGHVEEVRDLLARGERVEVGVDDLLEALLGTGPVLVEDLGLAEQGVGVHRVDPVGVGRLLLAGNRGQVGDGGLVFRDDPVHQLLMVTVGRAGVAGEDVVHEGRGAPVAGQDEVGPGAHDARFRHALLLGGRIHQLAALAIEVVDDQVALVYKGIQLLVDGLDVLDGAVVGAAELVHVLGAFATAVLLAAAPVELIAAGVGHDVPGRVVDAAGVAERVDELGIDGRQGRLGVVVRLIEIFVGDDTLLLDVQQVLVA